MGRGRRGLIDQSQKKPKSGRDKERGESYGVLNRDEKKSLLLLDEVVNMMKQMSFQQLTDFLLNISKLKAPKAAHVTLFGSVWLPGYSRLKRLNIHSSHHLIGQP